MKINRVVVALTILCSWQMLNTAPFIPHAYVANGGYYDGGSSPIGDQTVSVINTMTDTVVATVTLGAKPTYNGIAITPDNATVLVTCNDGTVNRIDVASNTRLLPDISLGLAPGKFAQSIAIAPNGLYAYVTCSDLTIRRINLTTLMVDATINAPTPIGLFGDPQLLDIAIAPDGLTAYVCYRGYNSIFPTSSLFLSVNLVNNTLGAYAEVSGGVYYLQGLLIHPTAPYAYAGNDASQTGDYFVFDISNPLAPALLSTVAACETDSAPMSFAISPDNQYLYTTLLWVAQIDAADISSPPFGPSSCTTQISPFYYMFMPAVTPDGTKLYMTLNDSDPAGGTATLVGVFSLANPAAPLLSSYITVGQNPAGIAITQGPPIPPPPTNVLGRLFFLNSSVCQILNNEGILDITWTASTGSDVVSYNIYLDDVLIGTVPANGPLVFQTPFKASYLGKTFYVAAVSSFGVESIRVPVVIGSGQDAPTNVKGIRRNNVFLNSIQCILVISWIASDYPSVDIVSYLIYRDNTIIGIVSADDLLCFQTCIRACDCGKIFYVAAVDSDGRVSNRVPVEIVS